MAKPCTTDIRAPGKGNEMRERLGEVFGVLRLGCLNGSDGLRWRLLASSGGALLDVRTLPKTEPAPGLVERPSCPLIEDQGPVR